MASVDADALESFARGAMAACGAPDDTARVVAESLVSADLTGHTSHGVVRLPFYADLVADGSVDPTATPAVEEAGPFFQIVGGDAFGQLTGRRAAELLVDETERAGATLVGVRNSGHVGRVGEWAERVTDRGFLFASWANLQGGAQRIAPPGSADRRLGTNPITFGVPSFDALSFDLIFDAATSQVAHGKIVEREGSGERLPESWTVTGSGDPVDRAAAFEAGEGAMLPLGGRATGYKGFGLALMAELFAAIVGDGPVSTEPRDGWIGNGAAFLAIDPAVFTTRDAVETRVAALAEYVRSAEPIEDSDAMRLPGEVEYETARRRRAEGVPVEDRTAEELRRLARSLEIESDLPAGLR